jgi:hypothetical protein
MFEKHCRQARVIDVWLEIMGFCIGKRGGAVCDASRNLASGIIEKCSGSRSWSWCAMGRVVCSAIFRMKAFSPKLGEVQAIYPAFAWEGSYVALTRFFYVQFENLHLIKGAVYFLL